MHCLFCAHELRYANRISLSHRTLSLIYCIWYTHIVRSLTATASSSSFHPFISLSSSSSSLFSLLWTNRVNKQTSDDLTLLFEYSCRWHLWQPNLKYHFGWVNKKGAKNKRCCHHYMNNLVQQMPKETKYMLSPPNVWTKVAARNRWASHSTQLYSSTYVRMHSKRDTNAVSTRR